MSHRLTDRWAICCDHAGCEAQIAGRGTTDTSQRRSATFAAEREGWAVGRFGELGLDFCGKHRPDEATEPVLTRLYVDGVAVARKRGW